MSLLRILTYNIRYNTSADGEHAWPHRRDRVADLLHLYRPDLFGLQEALSDQMHDLRERMDGYSAIGVGREDGRDGGRESGEFAPIFYRPDRLDLLESQTFWLSPRPSVPGTLGWDAACVRIATWALFADRDTRATFLHVNTHFDHQGTTAQLQSARLLRTFLAEHGAGTPALITGDFNCTPDSPTYAALTGAGTDSAALTEPGMEMGNIPPLTDTLSLSQSPHYGPAKTFNERFADPLHVTIDYIFAWDGTASPAITVHRHATLADKPDGFYPSDHLPVLADVSL